MREEFEKWILNNKRYHIFEVNLWTDEQGNYGYLPVATAWAAWQAGYDVGVKAGVEQASEE